MQVRDEERLIEKIMTTYAQLPPEKRKMFIQFIGEICDNEKDPPQGNADRSKPLAEGQ